jgi:hypothetical protein
VDGLKLKEGEALNYRPSYQRTVFLLNLGFTAWLSLLLSVSLSFLISRPKRGMSLALIGSPRELGISVSGIFQRLQLLE